MNAQELKQMAAAGALMVAAVIVLIVLMAAGILWMKNGGLVDVAGV